MYERIGALGTHERYTKPLEIKVCEKESKHVQRPYFVA